MNWTPFERQAFYHLQEAQWEIIRREHFLAVLIEREWVATQAYLLDFD